MTPSMNSWKSKVSRIKSRCGFCEEIFLLWSDRNDHLTDHFRAGALMKDWKGCRGLEPAIALLVQNAISPYLIGTEANDPEPFSASKGITKSVYATAGSSPAPTAYSALTAGLGEYVHAAKVAGSHVTDEALPDNSQWLNMFKAGYGLDCDPCQQPATDPTTNACQPTLADPQPSLDAKSLSPFTPEAIQQAVGFDPAIMQFELNCSTGLEEDPNIAAESAFMIPWSWQTPECLAEFRQLGLLPTASNTCSTWNSGMTGSVISCSVNKPTCGATPSEDNSFMPNQTADSAVDGSLSFAHPLPGMKDLRPEDLLDDTMFALDTELESDHTKSHPF
ncbi:hypothetical protein NM208_g9515 [Fusarium decemcellulare]|uniref:Uncharacterized protein n=1 Tax=Fusarium decemcellulare TaxID=57161 RepID=A0ACC1S1A3_9HYPO|nr:hypothetical protein NM208_g9515 [Fusarium decemcellulare]